MRLLKWPGVFLLAVLFVSCRPQAPITPQDAYHDLQRAVRASDTKGVLALLSKGSLRTIGEATALFSRMNQAQLETLSARYRVSASFLRAMKPADYLDLSLQAGGKEDVLTRAARYRITDVDRSGGRATITVENGMRLMFVKEGPYWKLDLGEI